MGDETQGTLDKRTAFIGWLMFGLGALFYFYEYLLRVSPSVMTTELMTNYHINAAQLGHLTAFYYYIYAPMQMPVGMLMDRYGPRKLLSFAALCCAVGAHMFIATDSLLVAAIGRFLVGFGSAFAFVGVLKLATLWLPSDKFAIASGVNMAIGTIGGMVGDIGLTKLVQEVGWRETSYEEAIFGGLLTVLLFLVLRDGPKGSHHELPRTHTHFGDVFKGFYKIIRSPQIWINGMVGCLMYVSTAAFTELWGIPYLKQVHHLTPEVAATTISSVFLGWAIGGPIVGFISDRTRKRVLPMTIGSAVGAILISVVFYVPNLPLPALMTVFFFFGLFSSAQVICFAVGREISPSRSAGTAVALTNMFVMLSGVIFQPLVGLLLTMIEGTADAVSTAHVYSAHSYDVALSVIPIGLMVSVLLTFFMRETHGRLIEDA